VDRALSTLEILAEAKSLTLTQLADRLGAGKTTAFRLATFLVERGWLVKDDDLRYRLGPGALGLVSGANPDADLKVLLRPIMVELHEETQETIHLTRLDGRYVVYLEQLVSPKPVLSVTSLGSRSPAHCVSSGLAQLAALPESRVDWILRAPLQRYTEVSVTDPDEMRREVERVRERGYGLNSGAFRKDVGGIGVAVLNGNREPVAGLSICMPVYRMVEHDLDALGQRLMAAARDAAEVIRSH
jgi:DNA-binding IclR family transcriptional regulator